MYKVHNTRQFARSFKKLPANEQKRILNKIEHVARDPYASNPNITKLQGREGYRLRVGDWRVLYELQDEQLIMLCLDVGSRGGIYGR